jgi:hypothetical protein
MMGLAVSPPPRQQALFRISNAIGWVMMVSSLLLFGTVADNMIGNGYIAPIVTRVWQTGAAPIAIGGQWLVAGLVGVVKLLPKSGPEVLAVVSISLAAILLGLFARTLRRRNWSAWEATMATLLVAVHPATLYMATTGQPLVLVVALTAFVVLAVDRAEALGDAQSLMGLGIAAALLFITTPNAIYVVMPVITILPVALRDITSAAAALSIFVLTLMPSCVVVGGIMIAGDTIGLRMSEVIQIWSSPLHGVTDDQALSAPWLAAHGGRFGLTLWDLSWLCVLCTPQVLLVVQRIAMRHQERTRPATAILTLCLPVLTGAFAAMFWHISSPWPVIGVSIACTAAWAVATPLRLAERRFWVLLLLTGDLLAWTVPAFWDEADKLAWFAAIF